MSEGFLKQTMFFKLFQAHLSKLAIVVLICLNVTYWKSGRKLAIYHKIYAAETQQCDKEIEKPKRRFPDAIGIGIPRCGTKSYMKFLKHHGYFTYPLWESFETEYFSKRRDFGEEWYQNIFEPSFDDQLTMETTRNYFYAAPKSIPQDMLKVNQAVKIFLLLCDPTPRTYSCFGDVSYNQLLLYGVKSYEEWVERTLPKLQKELANLNETSLETFLFEKRESKYRCFIEGLYFVHMERWKKYFNATQLLVMDGEEVMKNPGPQYLKIQDFFGVPQNFRKEDWEKNKSTGHFCLRLRGNKTTLLCQSFTRAKTRSLQTKQPSEKIVNALKEFYRPFNEQLFKILGTRYQWL